MKTFLIISFLWISLLAAFAANRHYAQKSFDAYKFLSEFKGDTASYLIENFVTHQANYKNKPLRILLKKLEVPVITYGPSLGGNVEGGLPDKCIAVVLKFFSVAVISKKAKNNEQPAVLIIYFKDPQPREKSDQLFMKYHKFTNEVKEYYGRQLVDSISYVHYKPH